MNLDMESGAEALALQTLARRRVRPRTSRSVWSAAVYRRFRFTFPEQFKKERSPSS